MAADLCSDHKPIGGTTANLEIDPSPTPSGSDLEGSASDATSCISSAGHVYLSLNESNAGHEVSAADYGMAYPTAGYYGYYYPGCDGYSAGSDGQAYVPEVQYPVMHADPSSFLYFFPGSGYNGCDPQFPAADGQYFGQQPYSASPMHSPTTDSPGTFPTPISYGSEYFLPSYVWDSSYMVGGGLQGSGYAGVLGSQGYGQNQLKPPNKGRQHSSTYQYDSLLTKGHHPKYPFNYEKDRVVYSSDAANSKKSGKLWDSSEKTILKSKANVVGDLNEHKCDDSRASSIKDNVTGLSIDGKEGTGNNTTIIRRDEYNLPDFLTKYDQALFFVIKSYSEDDIHKSIKYNVWASTPNGNKRLDSAYQTAQEKAKERGSKCPVFLFFSVNASGQFCGVAEMVGRVNFNKSMDFWQQDKWNGYFPVKWHIIKDVPNPHLRHIILENNENKPVTNSRDTQEVYFPQGTEMLNTFKNYAVKTSILDDFSFYESRQKMMQNKKKTPLAASHFDNTQKKVDEITLSISSIDVQTSVKSDDPVAGDMGKD